MRVTRLAALLVAGLCLAGSVGYAASAAAPVARAAAHKHHKKKKKKKRCHTVKVCRRHHKCRHVRKCKKRKSKPAPEPAPSPATPPAGGPLPSFGPEPAPSLFGLDTGTLGGGNSRFVQDFSTAQQIGARWLHFTGGSIHFTSSGQVDYSTMDYEVTQARKLGMGVVMSLGGAPSACSIQGQTSFEGCPPTTQADLDNYKTYLNGLLAHYHNAVDYYESWVEPNHYSFWPSGPDPQQYANLLETEWSVFQTFNAQNHTDMKLLFAGPSDFDIQCGDITCENDNSSQQGIAVLPFTHAVLDDLNRDLPGQQPFDGVALHGYRFPFDVGPDDSAPAYVLQSYPNCAPTSNTCDMTWPQDITAYESEFTSHSYTSPPLWLTEFGWPGNPVGTDDTDQMHPDINTQASDLQAAYTDLKNLSFVQAAFWFNLRDYEPGVSNPDPEPYSHLGLYYWDSTGPTSEAKPAAGDFQSLATGH